MKFSNVRLLVKDFAKRFKFSSEQLGLEPAWGDENSGYAYFKVADGIEGFALFVSDWMAPSVGNADKELPVGYREKSLVAFSVDNVDDTYRALKEKGVIVSVSAILSCRPFFILIFLLCIKMKHYGFSRKSIWKNLETFP